MLAGEFGEGDGARGGLVVDELAIDRDAVVGDGGFVWIDDKCGRGILVGLFLWLGIGDDCPEADEQDGENASMEDLIHADRVSGIGDGASRAGREESVGRTYPLRP